VKKAGVDMFAEKYLKAGVVMAASLMMLATASDPAFAQQRLQTPRGDQTVAPSEMPQQPSLADDMANPSKMNENVIPRVPPDIPGVPGVEPPGTKPSTGPGTTINSGSATPEGMQVVPTAPGGQPLQETPRAGGIVGPEGTPSSVRIGPVEPIPVWQRATLAIWLTVQFVVLLAVAIAMTLLKVRNDERDNAGHIIHPDTTNPSLRRQPSDLL
jgi:hypothetical protein